MKTIYDIHFAQTKSKVDKAIKNAFGITSKDSTSMVESDDKWQFTEDLINQISIDNGDDIAEEADNLFHDFLYRFTQERDWEDDDADYPIDGIRSAMISTIMQIEEDSEISLSI